MKSEHSLKTYTLILFALSLAVSSITDNIGFHRALDYVFYDSWHQLSGSRYPPSNTVIVTIDDDTLAEFPDDPLVFWTPQIAKASQVLRSAGVKIIGLDFMFSISPEKWLKSNLSWNDQMAQKYALTIRNEIATGKMVMVAASQEGEKNDSILMPSAEFLLPIPDFDIPNHIGLADLQPSSDGAVRKFIVKPTLNLDSTISEGAPQYTFGALLVKRAFPNILEQHSGNDQLKAINYSGPPGTIPRIKLKNLLHENAGDLPEVKALKNKIAIIGGEYQGMSDTHITPYSSNFFGQSASYMTGPEIQANIVETLLSNENLKQPSKIILFIIHTIILIVALILFNKFTTNKGIAIFFSLILIVCGISFYAFNQFLIIPTASLITGISMIFFGNMLLRYIYIDREKQRVTKAFGKYVSPAIVEDIVKSGEAPKLGGIKREITVLFSDIRNFTTISERLEPEQVVEMLNYYFDNVTMAVLEEGGTIDKFIGDAIMVQFGAPKEFEDHADRAIRAALKIKEIAELYKEVLPELFPDKNLPTFNVGIGINTGSAIIGNMGSSTNMGYTAIGDVTNSTARIESKTKELHCTCLLYTSDAADED